MKLMVSLSQLVECYSPSLNDSVEAHDKKRDRSTNAAKKRKKKVAQLSKHDGVDTEPEDESESVRKWYSKLKKQKIVEDEPVPLRRTGKSSSIHSLIQKNSYYVSDRDIFDT